MDHKLKCEYPGCKKESKYRQIVKIINEDDSSIEFPFCEYHYFIVMGGHFNAKIIEPLKPKTASNFQLIGPFKEVEIAEQVIGAKEMIFQLKSNDKKSKRFK